MNQINISYETTLRNKLPFSINGRGSIRNLTALHIIASGSLKLGLDILSKAWTEL